MKGACPTKRFEGAYDHCENELIDGIFEIIKGNCTGLRFEIFERCVLFDDGKESLEGVNTNNDASDEKENIGDANQGCYGIDIKINFNRIEQSEN